MSNHLMRAALCAGALALVPAFTSAQADPLRHLAQIDRPAASMPMAAIPVFRVGTMRIEQPWARATPTGARVAGGYLRITNEGAAPDRLVGGSFAFAGRVEIHEMTLVEGIMRMRPLDPGLEIAPGQSVELKPGGYHVMFMDLREGLKAGQSLSGSLVFEQAGKVDVTFTVAPIGAQSPAAGGHGHH
jgi:copper(I)-binding protein